MSVGQSLGLSFDNIIKAEQLNFSANIDAEDGAEVEREVPFDGQHIELLYGASAATQNLVGVQMMNLATGEQVFPADRDTDWVNLAGVNHPFMLVFPVEEDDILEVIFENQDTEAHYVNVVSTIAQFEGDGTSG